jgi:hypothetical protein
MYFPVKYHFWSMRITHTHTHTLYTCISMDHFMKLLLGFTKFLIPGVDSINIQMTVKIN